MKVVKINKVQPSLVLVITAVLFVLIHVKISEVIKVHCTALMTHRKQYSLLAHAELSVLLATVVIIYIIIYDFHFIFLSSPINNTNLINCRLIGQLCLGRISYSSYTVYLNVFI